MRPDVLEQLLVALPPPDVLPSQPPWEEAPAKVGFAFPQDYRAFVNRYGGGDVNGELEVFTPVRDPSYPGQVAGFEGYVRFATGEVGAAFEAVRREAPEENPYPMYPASGGLLVWGRTYSGDHLFWLTGDADPDRWPVVIFFRDSAPPNWDRFDGGMADLLLAVVSGTYEGSEVLIGPTAGTVRWTIAEDWAQRYAVEP